MAKENLVVKLAHQSLLEGDREGIKEAVLALLADKRAKKHHAVADQLEGILKIARERGTSSVIPMPNSKADTLFFHSSPNPELSLEALCLPVEVRKVISSLVSETLQAKLLEKHGLSPRHRVLFTGPPGNGKTSLAGALAAKLDRPLFAVNYPNLFNSYLGETVKNISKVFGEIGWRECVFFFDEFDAVGSERGEPHESREIKRAVNQLLLEIDRLPSRVLLVAATNLPEVLDRAMNRRFQVQLELPSPTPSDVRAWLGRFFGKLEGELGARVCLDDLAAKLNGRSYSKLEDYTLDLHRRHVLGKEFPPEVFNLGGNGELPDKEHSVEAAVTASH